MSTLAESAFEYASRGWHVFPLLPRGKRPLTRRGFHDASSDVGLARAWWSSSPAANIGIDCGRSGLLVVDLDGEQGRESWADWAARHGGHEPTLAAETGGGGLHVYFTGAGPSSTRRLGEGIDTRGAGGYVVAPPSVHESGRVYRWLDPCAPLAEAPGWLLEALAPATVTVAHGETQALPLGIRVTPYGRKALEGLADDMLDAVQGVRNETLRRVACRAGRLEAAGELDAALAEQVLVRAACANGLDLVEAARTFASGFNFGRQYPAARAVR